MITYIVCQDCPTTWTGYLAEITGPANEHRTTTWHTLVSHRMRYFDGRGMCDRCLSWPCKHTRPEPVLINLGAPTRFPGTPLKSGHRLCERHELDRSDWTNLDPSCDVAKRLVRPTINLVQIGSPATQLKYGESYLDTFRRIVGAQVAVVDSICAARTMCADVVPLDDVHPAQHCLSEQCPIFGDHKIIFCQEIQWVRCTCPECGGLYA